MQSPLASFSIIMARTCAKGSLSGAMAFVYALVDDGEGVMVGGDGLVMVW
jgi:hypothetical protein